jgi:Restriction alleviation protein Lar
MTNDLHLKLCPFCASSTAPKSYTASQQFLEYGLEDVWESLGHPEGFCVICDASTGGCGAQGGGADSAEQAIEKWNLRNEN